MFGLWFWLDYDHSTKEDKHTGMKATEIEVMVTQQFVFYPQTVMTDERETFRLSCKVDRLEGVMVLLKSGTNKIAVASQIIE